MNLTNIAQRVEAAIPLVGYADVVEAADGLEARLTFDRTLLAARADAQGLLDASPEAAAGSPRVQRMIAIALADLNRTLPGSCQLTCYTVAGESRLLAESREERLSARRFSRVGSR